MKKNNYSRRDFLKKSVISTSGIVGLNSFAHDNDRFINNVVNNEQIINDKSISKLPRQIWISAISQDGIRAKNSMEMVSKILDILKSNIIDYHPDIICLPEIFPFVNIEENVVSLEKKVEISLEVVEQLSLFAKQNKCYVICPVYTSEKGKIYNSAVIIDRIGNKLGEYRKIYTTEDETNDGVTPGSKTLPIFKTDFGNIGIQICYDIMWDDSWKQLSEKGAEIIFWPSAFAGGQMVNAKAWQNMSVIVSSTWKNTSKICDITGEVIAETGNYSKNIVCAPVNLEKTFLHSWPGYLQFEKIKKKYGRKIQITTFHEEEWSIIESLSPDVRVADILKEFNLRTKRKLLQDSEKVQDKARL